MEKTVESLAGYVEHIIYRNADNGYTVLNLVSGEDEITCVGIFSAIAEGENIEAQGEYTEHPTYGQQFKVTSFEEKAPEDEEAIERYLGSGAIKGIGLAMAARIVRRFKEDTFRIIEEEPERLAEIKGISNRKAMEIASQVNEKRDLRQAMIFLQQYGITMNLAVKVYQAYGQDVYGIIRENPYRLADDIDGVGFRTADEIAARVGIRMDSDFRVRSGILYTLLQASGEGHTYLPETELTPRASKLLNVTAEQVEKQYMDLAIERKIILKQMEDQTQIYAASFYYMEANTATMLKRLNVSYDVSDAEIEQRIRGIEKKSGMTLDEHQVTAVKEAVRNGLLVITGGPGTGKTTTINTIIRYFELEGLEIFLAAPTGRAAKRMSETTGFEARTVHRMLELNGGAEGSGGFERDESNPLEADVIINVVLQLIKQKLPKFVDATPYDIQVLTPMRKGLLGVERLNGILQRYMNPPANDKVEKEYGSTVFREGDKVMQTKNNYQLAWEIRTKFGLTVDKGLGIFNGDMGIIRQINDFAEQMIIEFDEGRMVEYPYKLLDELELAYAITIHKSQGSEYPAVVIPLLSGPMMLMNRNLLYTAVTRARKCVTLVGNEVTFQQMIRNTSQQKRYSGLCDRLKEN